MYVRTYVCVCEGVDDTSVYCGTHTHTTKKKLGVMQSLAVTRPNMEMLCERIPTGYLQHSEKYSLVCTTQKAYTQLKHACAHTHNLSNFETMMSFLRLRKFLPVVCGFSSIIS